MRNNTSVMPTLAFVPIHAEHVIGEVSGESELGLICRLLLRMCGSCHWKVVTINVELHINTPCQIVFKSFVFVQVRPPVRKDVDAFSNSLENVCITICENNLLLLAFCMGNCHSPRVIDRGISSVDCVSCLS